MEDSSLGRVASVLVSPAKTFQSIAERPTWLVALLVLIAAGLISAAVSVPKVDWEEAVRSDLARKGQELPPEQMDAALEVGAKFGSVVTWIAVVVGPWIIYPVMAAIFLGLFRILGSEMPFKTSLAVAIHGFMPWLVATLLNIPIFLSKSEITAEELQNGVLMSHAGVLGGEDAGPTLTAFLSSLDVFSVWAMVLMTLGYSLAAKVSRGRAAACVVGVWVVYVAGKVGLTALGQMAAGG